MSDQDLLANLQALLAKSVPASPSGWTQPQPSVALVQGVGVPVKVHRGRGTIHGTNRI